MRHEDLNVLGEDEITTLARKWWGYSALPRHYFDALKEAARLGADRVLAGAPTQAGALFPRRLRSSSDSR